MAKRAIVMYLEQARIYQSVSIKLVGKNILFSMIKMQTKKSQ